MSTPRSFFPYYYLHIYQDVAQSQYGSENGAVRHFERHGINEGRSPNSFFIPKFYLEKYEDLRIAFGSNNYAAALEHWLDYGIVEGRQGSPIFDSRFYLNSYPDLVSAFGPNGFEAACNHWIEFGIREGRLTTNDFRSPILELSDDINFTEGGITYLAPVLVPIGLYLGRTIIKKAVIWGLDRIFDRPRPPRNNEDMRPKWPDGSDWPEPLPPGDYPEPGDDVLPA